MRISAVLFVIAVSMALTGSVTIKTLVFPIQSSDSYVEMIPLKPLQLKAFTLCMRVATELSGKREAILFTYRSREDDELNVWLESDGRLSLYLSSKQGVLFRVPELGVLETHVCVTWDSSSGAASLFMDGRKSQTKIYKKAHTIPAGGQVLLGQDVDGYPPSFDPKQSFIGEISDVNMWDSVLSDSTIHNLVSWKKVQRGNVFDWETSKLRIHGRVEVINREV